MDRRSLSDLGVVLVALAVLWWSFGAFGWFVAGLGCLVLAALARYTEEPTREHRNPTLVTCPSCHARESADRSECRTCGEPL